MELQVTKHEEQIYNTHLKIMKQRNTAPYKLRKNFDTLSNEAVIMLKRISVFLNKHPHIDVVDFFTAPFKVYPDETYFDLQYFTTLKAVKSYSLYQKQLLTETPDSDEQLYRIQKSLKFILTFCRDNKISVDEYLTHKQNNTPSFIIHLKEHSVNIYTLYGLDGFESEFRKIDSELIKFMFDESIYNSIQTAKVKLYGSKKALQFIKLGIERMSEIIKKNS